jgi:hypothetical protein
MRFPLTVLAVLVVLGASLTAASLSGTWTVTLDPGFSGNSETLRCDVTHEGSSLTADCGDGAGITGTVEGRAVRFVILTGQNHLLPARFSGELDQREAAIAGTWTPGVGCFRK